jgi:16S rRNA (uracil1498-N3)-methyltransferase
MNQIALDRDEVRDDGIAVVRGARARHLQQVLKVAPGHTVRVGLVDGPRGTGTVQETSEDAVTLSCQFETETPTRPPVDLLLALPRPKVLRRLWAQLAALGVGRIMLVNAGKVERNYFDTHWLAPETVRTLLIEGLQQARDTRLPEVSVHRRFRPFIEDELDGLVGAACRIVADPSADPSMAAVVRARTPRRCVLAVGPEGGWNPFELTLLASRGFLAASLGPRPLRTDTACVAALALVHDALASLS